MMSRCITSSRDERGIVEVRMDEPEHRNGFTDAFCSEFMEVLDAIAKDRGAKVVVLRGRADVFSSGASREMLDRLSAGDFEVKDMELPERLSSLPLPTIAALEGAAVGGGLVLALCADIVVASEEARYGFNFTDLGFTPGMGSTRLVPALVGPSFASEMLLAGKLYRGRELAGRGLFTHVVPRVRVLEMVMDLAERMADKPANVLRLLKETLAAPRIEALGAALSREQLLHRLCFHDPATAQRIHESYAPTMSKPTNDRPR